MQQKKSFRNPPAVKFMSINNDTFDTNNAKDIINNGSINYTIDSIDMINSDDLNNATNTNVNNVIISNEVSNINNTTELINTNNIAEIVGAISNNSINKTIDTINMNDINGGSDIITAKETTVMISNDGISHANDIKPFNDIDITSDNINTNSSNTVGVAENSSVNNSNNVIDTTYANDFDNIINLDNINEVSDSINGNGSSDIIDSNNTTKSNSTDGLGDIINVAKVNDINSITRNITIRFKPSNYEYLNLISKINDKSINKYINDLVEFDQDRRKPEIESFKKIFKGGILHSHTK